MNIASVWNALYWTWVASEFVVLLVTRTRRSTGTVQDRGSLLILWPVIFISLITGISFGATHPHTFLRGVPWVLPACTAVLAAGIVLRWTAILQLGKSFSVNVAIHATQTVRKTGLYRFARHPSYTAMLIIFLAIGVLSRNWLSLGMIVLPPVAALLYRIHVEEIALRNGFGAEYVEYSRTTKRLIPGIY